jgi:hypothetical protein
MRGANRLNLTNVGVAIARNVRMQSPVEPIKRLLMPDDFATTFPIAELRPNEPVVMIANIYQDTEIPVRLIFTWDDDLARDRTREILVNVE